MTQLVERFDQALDGSIRLNPTGVGRVFDFLRLTADMLDIDYGEHFQRYATADVHVEDDNGTKVFRYDRKDWIEATQRYYIDQYSDEQIKEFQPEIPTLEGELEEIKGERGVADLRERIQNRLTIAKAKVRNAERYKKKVLDDLDINVKSVIQSRIEVGFEKQGGIMNDEQRHSRIAELEQKVVDGFIYEFFPTPSWLVDKMLVQAKIRPGMNILEPSAGKGNIADRIAADYPQSKLDVVEYHPVLRELLGLKGYNIAGNDFLAYDPDKRYDRIIMNPPFDHGLDRKHIMHAYKMLKPGGILVAIASYAGVHKNEPSVLKFKKLIEETGYYEDLPADTMRNAERSANIHVNMIVMERPLHEKAEIKRSVLTTINAGDYLKSHYFTGFVFKVVGLNPDKSYEIMNMQTGKKQTLELPSHKFYQVSKEEADAAMELQAPVTTGGQEPAVESERRHGGLAVHGDGKRHLPERGDYYCNDPYLKPVGIIEVLPEYVKNPDRNYLDRKTLEFLRPHQVKGVNLSIESLLENNSFLLADGTGSGKTVQELTVAKYFVENFPKNCVIIFTESDKIISKAFYADAEKMGVKQLLRIITGKEKRLEPGRIYLSTYFTLDMFFIRDNPQRVKIEDTQKKLRALNEQQKQEKKLIDAMEISKKQKQDMKSDITRKYANMPIVADYQDMISDWYDMQEKFFEQLSQDVSTVIFDESHNLKNLHTKDPLQGMRARRAMAISRYAGSTLFCSATPFDKVDHIFYLRRLNIFRDEEHYERFLVDIGYKWTEDLYNEEGRLIRRGYWSLDNKFPGEIQLNAIDRLFTDVTEDGLMIKRELELVNMEIRRIVIKMPDQAMAELDAIEEYFDRIGDKDSMIDKMLVKGEQMRALEPYKIPAVVELTQKEIEEGRSVVIFVGLSGEGETHKPWGGKKAGTVYELKEIFSHLYGKENIGIVTGIGGKGANRVTEKSVEDDIEDFQNGKKRIMIVTHGAGGTGISLDDQICRFPRTLICVTAPMSANQNVQMLGRIYRANTKSRSRAVYLFGEGVIVEEWLSQIIAAKMELLNAVVKGQTEKMTFKHIDAESGLSPVKTDDSKLSAEREKEHSLFARKNEIDGSELPSHKPYFIQRGLNEWGSRKRGTDTEYIKLRAKTKADFDSISLYFPGMLENNEHKRLSSSYQGSYYLIQYSDNLWRQLLNFIKPESAKHTIAIGQVFGEGDIIRLKGDNIEGNAKAGELGIVVKVRKWKYSDNSDRFSYKVLLSNGNFINRAEFEEIEAYSEDDAARYAFESYLKYNFMELNHKYSQSIDNVEINLKVNDIREGQVIHVMGFPPTDVSGFYLAEIRLREEEVVYEITPSLMSFNTKLENLGIDKGYNFWRYECVMPIAEGLSADLQAAVDRSLRDNDVIRLRNQYDRFYSRQSA